MRIGTTWLRKNYVNPRASEPVVLSVARVNTKEVIFSNSGYLVWPHHIGLTVTQQGDGWLISDPSGRPLVSYMPTTADAVVEVLLGSEVAAVD